MVHTAYMTYSQSEKVQVLKGKVFKANIELEQLINNNIVKL